MKTVYCLGCSPQFRLPCVRKRYISFHEEDKIDLFSNESNKTNKKHQFLNSEEEDKILNIDKWINKRSKIRSLKKCIEINPLIKYKLKEFYKQFHEKIINSRNSREFLDKPIKEKRSINLKKDIKENYFSSFSNIISKISNNKYFDYFEKYGELETKIDLTQEHTINDKTNVKNIEKQSQALDSPKLSNNPYFINSKHTVKRNKNNFQLNDYLFPSSNYHKYLYNTLYKTEIQTNSSTSKKDIKTKNVENPIKIKNIDNLIGNKINKKSKKNNLNKINNKIRNSLENIKFTENEKINNHFCAKNYTFNIKSSVENKLNILYCENEEQFDRIYERYKNKKDLKGLGLTHIYLSPKTTTQSLNKKISIIKNKIGVIKSIVDYTYPKIFFSKITNTHPRYKSIKETYNSPYKKKLINLKKIKILEDQYYSLPFEIINKNNKIKK